VIVDGYCHCGISRYRPIESVVTAMAGSGVDAAVLVQHLGEFDNGYLQAVVSERPDRFVAVGLVDERSPDCWEALEALAGSGISGIRLTEAALAGSFPLCARAVSLGLTALLDLPSGVGAMRSDVEQLADAAAGRPIVISHFGYPVVDGDDLVRGHEILELAAVQSVYVLASGFGMFCEYPYPALTALAAEVVERFGADRVMWGSNFPESVDATTYRRDLDLLTGLDALSRPQPAAALTGGTARRVWFGR
jgi:L-fuconolactonase